MKKVLFAFIIAMASISPSFADGKKVKVLILDSGTDFTHSKLKKVGEPNLKEQKGVKGKDDDGKIWNFGDIVRKAQADFCNSDTAAKLVTSTDSYGYSDPWHYDSKGYIDLGIQFANALKELDK